MSYSQFAARTLEEQLNAASVQGLGNWLSHIRAAATDRRLTRETAAAWRSITANDKDGYIAHVSAVAEVLAATPGNELAVERCHQAIKVARRYSGTTRARTPHWSADSPTMSPGLPGARLRAYVPHPEREQRLVSAAAIARFALGSPDLYEAHRNELLSLACWKATEADGKYKTRFRTFRAREASAADRRHDHVVPRLALRKAMEREPDRAPEILRDAVACVVTKEEHDRLTALRDRHTGWHRYIAAGIDVYDEQEGRPFIANGQFVAKSA